MSVDRHFVLLLVKMQEGVGGSQIMVEGQHHKLFREANHGYFSRQW